MTLSGHQAEVRGMCVSSIGDFVVTGSQDRSVRIWQQTEEQLFLEEEADRRIEDAADKSAVTESKRIGAMDGSGQVEETDSAAVTGKPTDLGLKSGERLMEAIDIAIREEERREEHRLATLASENPHDDDEKKSG
jgi:U3 small nucleolar RNA-associated protein 12